MVVFQPFLVFHHLGNVKEYWPGILWNVSQDLSKVSSCGVGFGRRIPRKWVSFSLDHIGDTISIWLNTSNVNPGLLAKVKILLPSLFFFVFFFKDFISLFLERGEGNEKEREKRQCVVASHIAPSGDLACNPGVCPDWESNWWPFGSHAGTQSTWATPARAWMPIISSLSESEVVWG